MEKAYNDVREDDSLDQFVKEEEIYAFCDRIVSAWNDAH